MAMNDDHDRYLDLKGLSDYSSLSVRTLRDYISDEDDPLPSFCIRRKILVKKSEFDRWLSKHRAEPGKISTIAAEVLKEFKEAG